MTKVLKPYTIVPPHLYVKRDADRQIKNIINDMGRPGYVLVSRQMGKTNLLLNAKRELEGSSDVFVYMDLSTPYESAKSCFENIIDLAIETHEEKLQHVAKDLYERRKHYVDTPPHKQHLNELRLILKSFTGKLVIILDEIDALTKTNYSDQIFAQIRSIYFTRVNFEELNRLTYILSGVIEPSEIIKDSKISPFNIGQKIFLNDFSKDEFFDFLENSSLVLTNDVNDRIFYWANGNPRMSWDICSEVENILKTKSHLSVDDIDSVVNEMYLISFDKPPIDNIREIVKDDREIRNGLMEIHYGKGSNISAKIKNKLYLAGIVNYEENNIRIKNEVIKRGISADWIQKLEEEEKGLVFLASEYFAQAKYSEALATFEKYLETNDFDPALKTKYHYYMGYAAYNLSQFKKALHHFNETRFDPDQDGRIYYTVVNVRALTQYYLGDIDDALKTLEITINSGKKDDNYAEALLNYGSFSLDSRNPEQIHHAIAIFKGIIDGRIFEESKISPNAAIDITTIALFNLSRICTAQEQFGIAKIYLLRAREIAKSPRLPLILLQLVRISEGQERLNYLTETISYILDNKIIPITDVIERPLEFTISDFKDLLIFTYLESYDNLFKIIEDKLKYLGENDTDEHIFNLAIYSINKKSRLSDGIEILKKLYERSYADGTLISNVLYFQTVRLILASEGLEASPSIQSDYIRLFVNEHRGIIDYNDFHIFSIIIYSQILEKKYRDALANIRLIESVKEQVAEALLINYLYIYNLETQIYLNINDRNRAKEVAHKILNLSANDNIKQFKSNLLGDAGYDIVKANAENLVGRLIKPKPVKVEKKYGRNEIVKVRYKDGGIIETKFKKVEEQIRIGECMILL